MTKMGNSSWIGLTDLIRAGLTFGIIFFLSSTLPANEFGAVATYQSVIAICIYLVGFGTNGTASASYNSTNEKEVPELFGTGLIFVGCFSALAFIFVGFLYGLFPHFMFSRVELLFVILSASVQAALALIQVRYQMSSNYLRYVISGFLPVTVSFVILISLNFFQKSWINLLIGNLTGFTLTIVFLVAVKGDFKWQIKKIFFADFLKLGVKSMPHHLSTWAMGSADRLFVNQRFGLAETGVYSFASQLSSALTILSQAINNSLVPQIFRSLEFTDKKHENLIAKIGVLQIAIVGAMSLFLGIFASLMLRYSENPIHRGALEHLPLLLCANVIQSAYFVFSNIVFHSKRFGSLSTLTICGAIVKLGSLYVLLEISGIKGASISAVVAMLFLALANFFMARTIRPINWIAGFSENYAEILLKINYFRGRKK